MKAKEISHRIRCLRSICAYQGGREQTAKILGVTKQAIDRWMREGCIPQRHILSLVDMSNGRFSADELLGAHDESSIPN